jgi:hypothetical protein
VGENVKAVKTIGLCCPGENFSAAWVWHLFELWAQSLAAGYGLALFQSYCCFIHITRQSLMRAVFDCPCPVDYVLWIDHDNLVTWPQVERLIASLEAQNGEPSIIAGWYYASAPEGIPLRTVVGKWVEEQHGFRLLNRSELGEDLFQADACGFGCMLMKAETMKALGPQAFICPDGTFGEDFAFCLAAKKAGIKLFVDPKVSVPHLKLRALVPQEAAT